MKSYANHLRMLGVEARKGALRAAADAGDQAVAEAWRQLVGDRSGKHWKSCGALLLYAQRQKKVPAQFGDQDLVAWGEEALHKGRSPSYVRTAQSWFRKAIFRLGLNSEIPLLSLPTSRFSYGIAFDQLPPSMAAEIMEVLEWKQAVFAPGRSRRGRHRGRHRPVTATFVRDFLCRLYGFAIKFTDQRPSGLADLVTPEIIEAYSSWFLNTQGNQASSLRACLIPRAGLSRHPRYGGKHDYSWLVGIINDLPLDSEGAIQENKEESGLTSQSSRAYPHRFMPLER